MSDSTVSKGELNGSASPNEVRPSNKRKRYTASYKLRILEEAERCVAPGELAALIRREGIYSSTIADFRRQKARGELDGGVRSSRKITSRQEAELERRLAVAERENRKLRRDLEKSRVLLDHQKKVAEIMGITLHGEE